jgi:GntR family transcriptional regulator
MRIEPDSPVPIFQQIVDGVRNALAAGVYEPGELIPSVRAQAVTLLVNPNTVQRAYEQLEREGLVTSKKGTGMIVSANGKSVAQDGALRTITSAFAQGVALGCDAGLSRTSIDKTYRQAWKESQATDSTRSQS